MQRLLQHRERKGKNEEEEEQVEMRRPFLLNAFYLYFIAQCTCSFCPFPIPTVCCTIEISKLFTSIVVQFVVRNRADISALRATCTQKKRCRLGLKMGANRVLFFHQHTPMRLTPVLIRQCSGCSQFCKKKQAMLNADVQLKT